MRYFQVISIVVLFAAACGGSQSADPTTGSTATAGGDGTEQGGSGEAGAQNEPDPAADNEFQVRDSDDAHLAHGDRPSEIEATATEAAMRLFVVDPDAGAIEGVTVKMVSPGGGVYYTRPTDSQGYAEVLVPIGQRYEMEYLSLGRRNTTSAVEVRNQPNLDIRLTLRYRRYRPPEGEPPRFVLDGVTFETNSANIHPSSYPRLGRVGEYMTHVPSSRIRIAGHTDNVGNARANRRLSERRAQAVRDYLISRGIEDSRIEAVGYGAQRPVASNDTEEGRAQNRRIEAEEL